MIGSLLLPKSGLPLWLFVLRLAAQLASAMLLVFAIFIFSVGWQSPSVLIYALLMVLFASVNLSIIRRLRTPASKVKNRTAAYILNALLPLAYVLGAWRSDMAGAFELNHLVAVGLPPLLNYLAIEQSLRRHLSHISTDNSEN